MKRILLIILVTIFFANSFAQTFNSALAKKLQSSLDSVRTSTGIKGISASVFYPGQGMWKGVSGESYANTPITQDMEFGIGSNTKLFTAVALLKLVENNLLNLNDSLHQWLPPYNNIDPKITIRQILNHVSGIKDVNTINGFRDSMLTNPNRIFTANELMTWVGPPLFKAGEGWSYSNTNYLLAGMIAEKASGKKIAQLIRESILIPLQLDSTFYDVEESVLGTIAHPWQNGIDIYTTPRNSRNSAAGAAGAMYSTASEMAQWYQKLMEGGVVTDNSFKEMTTFVGSGNYGFGIGLQTVNGRTVWAHGGNVLGYRSQMFYDTSLKAVICVLTNSNPATVSEVASRLLSTLVNNTFTKVETKELLPTEISLSQNYPNPFNPITEINYQLPSLSKVSLKVFDILGKEVMELVNKEQGAGNYKIKLDASNLTSGVYFYQLRTNSFVDTKKLVLIK